MGGRRVQEESLEISQREGTHETPVIILMLENLKICLYHAGIIPSRQPLPRDTITPTWCLETFLFVGTDLVSSPLCCMCDIQGS